MSENDLPPRDAPGRFVDRRRFLYLTGAGGLVLAVVPSGGPPGEERDLALTANATRTLHLRRREDSLNLRVDLFNADLVQTGGGAELRKVTTGSAYLVVHFPPQAVLERVLTDPLRLADLPLPTRVAGPSRLAFDITAALPMAATLDALLGWTGFTPRLAPTATSTQTASALVAPTDTQTALELPWRVLLSPNENGAWEHAVAPVTDNGWTELWHTRLGVRTGDGGVDDQAEGRSVRAVWLADPQMATWVQNPASVPSTDDIAHLLTPRQRFAVVRLSADPTLRTGLDPALPKPIDVAELTLSSLGATADLDGRWTYPVNSALQLKSWQHRAGLGRDQSVRVTTGGFLFPYGHRAALVEVAERRFERRPNPDGSPGPWYAPLRRTQFVVVQQPVRTYAGDTAMPHGQRKLPFTSVRVLTRITPPLAAPVEFGGTAQAANAFVPKAAAASDVPFTFHLRGTDHDGHEVDFTAPVVFVYETAAATAAKMQAIHDVYNTNPGGDAVAARTIDLDNVKIALAQRGSAYPVGSTTANAHRLVFNSEPATGSTAPLLAAGRAPFYPYLERVVLELPEVAALSGGAVAPTAFEYAAPYLTDGIHAPGKHTGGVYLTLHPAGAQPALDFSPAATGVVTPSGGIRGLSAKTGPITADPIDVAKELYNPEKMFGDPEKAKLLGGLPIKDLLPVPGSGVSNPDQAWKVNHRPLPEIDANEWTLVWTPKVEAGPKQATLFEPLPPPAGAPPIQHLTVIIVYTHSSRAGVESTQRMHGELRDFALHLFGKEGAGRAVTIQFDNLRYTSASGAKTSIDCRVRDVSFHGALKFVEELAELCSFLGSKLEITAGSNGVRAGLRFAVPAIPLGVFALSDLTLRASVAIPFDGSAVRVEFDLNTREKPFNLRVYWFTGGGYASIALGADGLERLEIGFTFGATLPLDVGIASGKVEAVGGVCYLLEKVRVVENGAEVVRQQVGLTAFLRLRGSLDFFGLVKISVEFYLGLTYQEKTDGSSVLVGEASVTVSIEVWLFSETFTVRTRRELAKTAAPAAGARAALAAAPEVPAHPFGAAFTQQDWTDYCAAFAPVGA
ncbi:hypothetical protein [Saccharothrix syringae]|uniref:Uncharacterized protein n=1 Tax=Saccharothrix syringae TaxID=103733 RepID=A0A5Q0H352_SACSY|nr:hypothetical protein [Saccharothrix syringae]QFZ20304.1 hypothetical protein EKG83_25370 [Saccharothrix syringae]